MRSWVAFLEVCTPLPTINAPHVPLFIFTGRHLHVSGADVAHETVFKRTAKRCKSLCRPAHKPDCHGTHPRGWNAVGQAGGERHHASKKYLCRAAGKPPIKSLLGESSKGAFSRLCSGTEPESPPSACEGGRWFSGGLRTRLRSNLHQPHGTEVPCPQCSW